MPTEFAQMNENSYLNNSSVAKTQTGKVSYKFIYILTSLHLLQRQSSTLTNREDKGKFFMLTCLRLGLLELTIGLE